MAIPNTKCGPSWTDDRGTQGDLGFLSIENAIIKAKSGSKYLSLGAMQRYNGVQQTITTVVGQRYVIGIYCTSDNRFPNGIDIIVDSTTLMRAMNVTVSPSIGYYSFCSATFTATATSTLIRVIGGDLPGFLYIDDVSVYQCV